MATKYTIPAGRNRPCRLPIPVFDFGPRTYRITLRAEWFQQQTTGWCKLIGFSRGWHHHNSVRVGFKRLDNQTGLVCVYEYEKKSGFFSKKKGHRTWYSKQIVKLENGKCTFDFVLPELQYGLKIGYLLRPYFGNKDLKEFPQKKLTAKIERLKT